MFMHYKECEPAMRKTKVAACKSPHRGKESAKHSSEECTITMAHSMGCMHHECKEAKYDSKKVYFGSEGQYK
eukprot:11273540-Ditylum_brightwellii.AAC.1